MEKFSKLKPKDVFGTDNVKDDIVFSDNIMKIVKYEDWTIIKENDAVFCIPYLIEKNQIVIRNEYIPTFKYVDGQEYHITLVGGRVEDGEAPETAMLRELEEEAGIILNENYKLENLKPLFTNKGMTQKLHLYIIPLNEREYTEVTAVGDGSRAEKLSKSVKVDIKYLDSLNTSDLVTDYMILKVKEHMNLLK